MDVNEGLVESENHFEAISEVHGLLGGSCGHE
jgi:hypothetical protein